ncbi:MAG: glycoside hydrolase family 15 protein [Thermoleophilaceae bacterium]
MTGGPLDSLIPAGDSTRSPFPPIGDYGFLSDCEVTALVAPSGNVEWLCLPQFDSPSVFGSILDRDAGRFRVGPADMIVPAGRRYLPGTMMLETTWMTKTGWLIVRDALTIGPWHHESERAFRHRRSPTDWEAEHVLVRTVKCVQGQVELNMECEPVFDYGRARASWGYTGEGYSEAEATAEGCEAAVRLDTDLRMGFEGPRANARTTLREGDTAFVALSWSEHGGPGTFDQAYERMARTSTYWRHWLASGEFPDHPWQVHLERSALTLKGLSYAPTGAIASAATTSLPRVAGGTRNYDYRYSFIRDAAFSLWGLYGLGFDWEADDFFYFLADVAEELTPIRNMYAIDGRGSLDETELDHLEGYDGAKPVRVGNAAYDYEQHDVWGAMLDAAYLYARSRGALPERVWPCVERQVKAAVEQWREPDRGIWALRGEPRHFTSSKVLCWVAADRGARLAEMRDDDELAARWRAEADEIHADVLANGLDERGVFTQHYDTDELDASVLLIPLVRFLPPEDERVRATVNAIAGELIEGGLVLRHRTDGDVEGETFLVCSFWLVSALVEIDERERALELCERVLALAGPLGLFAEHIDPDTGRHYGNFPHAFTHLALVNAVMHLIDPREVSALLPDG